MCMLSFFPAGVMPDETRIANGAEVNPNGHGFAMVTGRPGDRRLIIHRSMDAAETIERFLDLRERHLGEGPALFHSRIATSGLIDITGCHPFRVGSDNRTVVGHNGILFQPAKNSLRSDTAIFADRMLPRFGSLDNPRKFAKLERWLGLGNKLVILTVNPNRRRNAYIANESAGWWVQGEWHSNQDYLGTWWKWPELDSKWKSDPDDTGLSPWSCPVCGATDAVDTLTGICTFCQHCIDCTELADSCLCFYNPRHVRTRTG